MKVKQSKMSFKEESGDGIDLTTPFLHPASWYRLGSRHPSMMGSSQAICDSSISVLACVLIIALGPIQFGFTAGYSSPTQTAISRDLGLTDCVQGFHFSVHIWEGCWSDLVLESTLTWNFALSCTDSWTLFYPRVSAVVGQNGYDRLF